MNSQQLAQNAHDAAPLGNLQSPFHHFPEILDGSKVPQALHSLPSYVQQQYAPDSGASLEGGGPPSLPYHLPERPQQGHPHLDPSSLLQLHQPHPTAAYPSFTHEHKGPHPTPHGCSHQHSRASEHSTQIPIGPRSINAFPDNASTRPTSLHGVISPVYGPPYALYSQPPYHPPPTHRSEPTHAPLEQPQPTTTPGPPTLHDQHEDREITVHGQRPRSWGGVGWLDPATRVYCGPPDHTQPPIRTKQACEKCRDRKAKVSIVSLPPIPLSLSRSFFLPTARSVGFGYHPVLRRASDMPAMPRAQAGMQIRPRAPYARTQQAEATTLNVRWVSATRRSEGTENPQTRSHLSHCSESEAAAAAGAKSAARTSCHRHCCPCSCCFCCRRITRAIR